MIEKFKENYWYKFVGNKNDYVWYDDIELISNGKWHKCMNTYNVDSKHNYVRFKDMKDSWAWDIEDFIESEANPPIINYFKENYWYKFVGNEDNFCWYGDRKIVLDYKWHKCINIGNIKKSFAQFEGMDEGCYWVNMEFIESKTNPDKKEGVKMIEEFKKGYWYKFVGDKNDYHWYSDMKFLLDGKWHKCINIGNIGKDFAQFEGMDEGRYWFNMEFIESKTNPDEKEGVKMENYFKKGYYYKYVGKDEDMNILNDKKYHLCISEERDDISSGWILFEGMEKDYYCHYNDFIESISLTDEYKEYLLTIFDASCAKTDNYFCDKKELEYKIKEYINDNYNSITDFDADSFDGIIQITNLKTKEIFIPVFEMKLVKK